MTWSYGFHIRLRKGTHVPQNNRVCETEHAIPIACSCSFWSEQLEGTFSYVEIKTKYWYTSTYLVYEINKTMNNLHTEANLWGNLMSLSPYFPQLSWIKFTQIYCY